MSHQENINQVERSLKHAEHMSSSQYSKLCRLRKHKKPSVSDHAIVRYQERVKLLPVNEVREKLLSKDVVRFYETLGDGTYPIGEGTIRVVITDGVIVTVYH